MDAKTKQQVARYFMGRGFFVLITDDAVMLKSPANENFNHRTIEYVKNQMTEDTRVYFHSFDKSIIVIE